MAQLIPGRTSESEIANTDGVLRLPGTLVVSALLMISCAREREVVATPVAGRTDAPTSHHLQPTRGPLGAHTKRELDIAATKVVSFLRGQVAFERIAISDHVMLHLSPEGGGSVVRRGRAALRDPSNWKVRSEALRMTYKFAPPYGFDEQVELVTSVGLHRNCLEYSLASRFKQLAQQPHVGTTLRPRRADSCLQSHNLTLVFDRDRRPATLVAAVYDQWEW